MSLPNTMQTKDRRIRILVPDPPPGLTSTLRVYRRAGSGDAPRGVHATTDPLHRTATDPNWSA